MSEFESICYADIIFSRFLQKLLLIDIYKNWLVEIKEKRDKFLKFYLSSYSIYFNKK